MDLDGRCSFGLLCHRREGAGDRVTMLGRPLGRVVGALLLACIALVPAAQIATAQTPTESGVRAQIEGDPLVPGTTAIVVGDGECLRIRDLPTLGGNRVDCIPDGRTVLVLPSTVEADGYRWQLVEWRGTVGWAADFFLAPYDGPPETAACQPSSVSLGITGDVPSQGGFGLVMWGGGRTSGMETAALARNCQLSSVWTSRPGG